jgi:two-component system LytT family response regulator
MRAIIVEDEINVRAGFKKMIKTFVPTVQVIGEADCVAKAFTLIQSSEFDLLFLDIKLPDGTGFDLLNQIEDRTFSVIFVTAYDNYAIDAFKVSATDYLIKPLSIDELKNAVANVKVHSGEIQDVQKEIWQNAYNQKHDTNQKIILKDTERVKLIPVSDIMYCHAEGSYTCFNIVDGSKITTSMHLKEYERLLLNYGFHRSHHSFLINCLFIVGAKYYFCGLYHKKISLALVN